jgi:hypothetical protein
MKKAPSQTSQNLQNVNQTAKKFNAVNVNLPGRPASTNGGRSVMGQSSSGN